MILVARVAQALETNLEYLVGLTDCPFSFSELEPRDPIEHSEVG
jgi:hypothetical protein